MNSKPGLHPRNKHNKGYNFDVLTQQNENLSSSLTFQNLHICSTFVLLNETSFLSQILVRITVN